LGGEYYPGGRRSLSAVAAVEEGGSAVGDEQEDCVQSEENECNIVDDSYSPDEVSDRNAGVNSHDSNDDSDDSEAGNKEGESHMAMRGYDGDNSDNCDSSDSYSEESDEGDTATMATTSMTVTSSATTARSATRMMRMAVWMPRATQVAAQMHTVMIF
jgi:hypothetical protein